VNDVRRPAGAPIRARSLAAGLRTVIGRVVLGEHQPHAAAVEDHAARLAALAPGRHGLPPERIAVEGGRAVEVGGLDEQVVEAVVGHAFLLVAIGPAPAAPGRPAQESRPFIHPCLRCIAATTAEMNGPLAFV
jgi:hypothetical protein